MGRLTPRPGRAAGPRPIPGGRRRPNRPSEHPLLPKKRPLARKRRRKSRSSCRYVPIFFVLSLPVAAPVARFPSIPQRRSTPLVSRKGSAAHCLAPVHYTIDQTMILSWWEVISRRPVTSIFWRQLLHSV